MLTLLSGSSIYRVSVTLEINGHPVTVDFHLRTSGGVDWSPYITPEHNAMLGQYFSTLDRVVYEKFLFLILEVSFSSPGLEKYNFQRYYSCAVDPTVPTIIDLCQGEALDVPHLVYTSDLSNLILDQMGKIFVFYSCDLCKLSFSFRCSSNSRSGSYRVLLRTLECFWTTQNYVDLDPRAFSICYSLFQFTHLP